MAESEQEIETVTAKRAKVESQKMPEYSEIPVDLMSGTGKLLKTVNNENEDYKYLMRDSEVEIKLARPVYISEVALNLGAFDNVKGMRLVVSDVLTNKVDKKAITVETVSGPSVRFIVGKVATSFVLHRGSFLSKDIKKIVVSGLFLDEIEKFERSHKNLLDLKEDALSDIDEKLSELNKKSKSVDIEREKLVQEMLASKNSMDELSQQHDALMLEVESLQKQESELSVKVDTQKKQLTSAALKIDELAKRNIAIDSELEQKTETLSSKNISISKAEEKLKGLVNNVNVFSEEFSGFVEQGRKQVNLYAILMVVPLLLLSVVVYNLFKGAVDLTTKFEKIPNIDLITLLVTRIPFVAVASLIIGVSIKIIYFLIGKITAIHQQRLDLAKIAIIAKDVSDASASQLDMPLEEAYEAKTYLKMALLKSYLSGQIATFSYSKRNSEASTQENEVRDEQEVENSAV